MASKVYKTLETTPPELLLKAFHLAFEDYALEGLGSMDHWARWQEVGVDLHRSYGVFEGEELLGFALLVPFDRGFFNLATGVLPKARGQRLIRGLLEKVQGEFISLEVLKENASAVIAYTRLGFRITRRLHTFRGVMNLAPLAFRGQHDVLPLNPETLPPSPLAPFEQRDEGLLQHAEDFEVHRLRSGSEVLATAVIRPTHLQLVRLNGAPVAIEQLLFQMRLHGESVGFVNVPEEETEVQEVLKRVGLVRELTHFEMRKMVH